jgi:uncharacterized membrane protein
VPFRSRQTLTAAACCAYPVLSHLSAVTGEPGVAAAGLVLVAWSVLGMHLRAARAALLGAAALGFAVAFTFLAPAAVLYAPPLGVYLGLGTVFAASLRRGREPVVSRFARLERGGELPPDLLRYTRILTRLWVLFFATMACISLGLAIWASAQAWSVFTNLVGYLLVAAFFLGEYGYRRLRFKHYRHAGFADFLRRIPGYRLGAAPPHESPADGS